MIFLVFFILQNSARRSAAYLLRGYCYFSKFLWPFHRLPPMHTKDVLSELPVLFLSMRYSPPSPKPCRLFLSNFPLYRFLSMVIILRSFTWEPLAFTIPAPPKFAFPPRSQPRFRPRRNSRYFLRASTTKYLVFPGTPESFPLGLKVHFIQFFFPAV